MGILSNIFGGGEITKGITSIASEWIETSTEKAEAKTVMLKALDPNGKMRRDLSTSVTRLYVGYMVLVTVLILMSCFDIGNSAHVSNAISEVTDLFGPLTGMFSLILGASFGVNAMNARKEGQAILPGK